MDPIEDKNILVLGSAGAGKSTFLNFLLGFEANSRFKTSDSLRGVTKDIDRQPFSKDNVNYCFYDSVGLNETSRGTVKHDEAIERILKFILELKGKNLHSIIFLINSGNRITDDVYNNYILFYKYLGNSKIPFICVLTKCDEIVFRGDDSYTMEKTATFTRELKNTNMVFNKVILSAINKQETQHNINLRNKIWEAIESIPYTEVPLCIESFWERVYRFFFGNLSEAKYKKDLLGHFKKISSDKDFTSFVDESYKNYKKGNKKLVD